ncbi:uncharacterized protein FFB20_11000 [Fusarium fujikuroi]|uniref:Uncharacterized protein n=1 Tax=Fusarium fujikuroi TaxID=5127 RepID=A0A2H3SG12_FUSFU|nr:uncharacterized protein FFB20_11000 [Fusarium fujikuroi]SCO24307.1 uncharacterized protein FFE2_15919 [Fusarium fujikuroi]SCO25565.1 uncharacterized protein FFC1_15591 [Fusarium fujikuroi]SCO53998.1 uncharacterized protein FFNC_15280 [Fusarium fujikuroi]VTT57979.1 unnamed protein product [Fusarium fujikuroi]
MEVQEDIRDLIDHIQLLQQNAGPMERQIIRRTTEILELCAAAQPQARIVDVLRVEIGQQKCWVKDYLKQQRAWQEVTFLLDGLTNASEDHEALLLRYCQETLEGARAIAFGLGISLSPQAWKVRHHKKPVACANGRHNTNGKDIDSAPGTTILPIDRSSGDSTVLERLYNRSWYY